MTAKDAWILVLNGGSSSLKFALFKNDEHTCMGRGIISGVGVGKKAVLTAKGPLFDDPAHKPPVLGPNDCRTTTDAARTLITWLDACLPQGGLVAVGHRVVHGGNLTRPMRIRPHLLAYLKTLIPLAPLHQPFNLEAMEMVMSLHPTVPQVACFDTAFHTTIPALHRRYAIPRVWHEKGVCRYGFHGLSYEYISGRMKEVAPKAFAGKTVIAHLGNGASLCALENGRSFDTTMGFSVLEGLMMGTRPGSLDAGILLYFMREAKLDEPAIERLLYHDCGLFGVSGISADMAELLESKEASAREAIDLFCLKVVREVGGFISMLGGLDALVFAGGIGEHAVPVRAQIAASLGWLGVVIDDSKNNAATSGQETLISAPQSKIEVWVIPTNEEAVIARRTREIAEEEKQAQPATSLRH